MNKSNQKGDILDFLFGALSPGEYDPTKDEENTTIATATTSGSDEPSQQGSGNVNVSAGNTRPPKIVQGYYDKPTKESSSQVSRRNTRPPMIVHQQPRSHHAMANVRPPRNIHQQPRSHHAMTSTVQGKTLFDVDEAMVEERYRKIEEDFNDDLDSFWNLTNELSETLKELGTKSTADVYGEEGSEMSNTSSISSIADRMLKKRRDGVIVMQDNKALFVQPLDCDEEAERILSIPKGQWTSKDNKVMNDLVVRKLENDYKQLGRKVENLSKFIDNDSDNKSVVTAQTASSWRRKSYNPCSSYHKLSSGIGNALRTPNGGTSKFNNYGMLEDPRSGRAEEWRSTSSSRRGGGAVMKESRS